MTRIGLTDSAVDAYARLHENAFRTLGERTGQDPFELYEPYRLKITRPLPEVLRAMPQTDIHLDTMIDRLRAGKVPNQQEMFGNSLTEFLRNLGGVKDEGGELASLEVDAERKPFEKRLIHNDKGLALDRAREALRSISSATSRGFRRTCGASLNTSSSRTRSKDARSEHPLSRRFQVLRRGPSS